MFFFLKNGTLSIFFFFLYLLTTIIIYYHCPCYDNYSTKFICVVEEFFFQLLKAKDSDNLNNMTNHNIAILYSIL